MNQVFTAAELQAKGITRHDVVRMLKRIETRVNSYVKQYISNGNKCSAEFRTAWDAECARWDHIKTTLEQMDLLDEIAEFFDVPADKVVVDKTAGDVVFLHVIIGQTYYTCTPADVKNSISVNWEHYGLPESLFSEARHV